MEISPSVLDDGVKQQRFVMRHFHWKYLLIYYLFIYLFNYSFITTVYKF